MGGVGTNAGVVGSCGILVLRRGCGGRRLSTAAYSTLCGPRAIEMISRRVAASLMCVVLGCTRAPQRPPPVAPSPDQVAVARTALAWIHSPAGFRSPDSGWVMVARAGSAELAALATLGPVVVAEQLPESPSTMLPEGHMRLDSLWVAGDSARFVGWFGPIPRPRPGVMLGCGERLKLWLFRRADSTWSPGDTYAITVC